MALINDPDRLIEDLIAGMLSAHPGLTVEGETGRAIVARDGPRDGKVGIVIGGGSGHEPAFAGYVGRGLADAAPLGNIFASPSPSQILDAGLAADGGAGVLFLYGNYTGDVMNFGMAAEQMEAMGIPARSFLVTDDIASAPPERAPDRRGIAGDFFVFKLAGAAADLGLDFAAVEAAAARANAATRTMGVALAPCRMPQTGKAGFEIPEGEMEIGMGIHGEPGIARVVAESADQVAERLLAPILEELALGKGDRVAVLVNGLGSTTLLELYLLHRRVAALLSERGVEIHRSWVGDYCTSLDMEGASVTLMKLDPELTAWLDHPCDTPALKVGPPPTPIAGAVRSQRRRAVAASPVETRAGLRTDGTLTPARFAAMLRAGAAALGAERDRLSALDGAIGDGDHGLTMETGFKAVLAALDDGATITAQSTAAANAFLEAVGATAGPLYGAAFTEAGRRVADRLNLDGPALAAWLEGMAQGIAARGGAAMGDKTMLDAWQPAAVAAGTGTGTGTGAGTRGEPAEVMAAAADAAEAGAARTAPMQSQRGRSSKLGPRSVGHVDPGAASAAVLLRAWAGALADG